MIKKIPGSKAILKKRLYLGLQFHSEVNNGQWSGERSKKLKDHVFNHEHKSDSELEVGRDDELSEPTPTDTLSSG